MGAPWEDKVTATGTTTETGQVYLVWGGTAMTASSNIDTIASSVISGALESDRIGGVLETNVNGHPLAIGDVTGDGIGDLVIGAPLSMLGVVSSTGVGKAEIVYGRAAFPTNVDLAADADVRMILWDSTARLFYTGYAVSAKDLNGDSVGDITVSTPCWQSNPANPRCDGIVHTIFGSGSLASSYYLDADSDFAFEPPPPTDSLSASETGTCLAIGEFTNSKTPDLALGSPFGGLNTRGWTAVFHDATLTTPYDFNSDGKQDILWRHAQSGKVGIWEMDGTTNLGWTTIHNGVNTVWDIPASADFIGDGQTDILWRHATSGKLGVWEMDGTTALGWTTIHNGINTVWTIPAVGDFTGDNKTDILWRHATSGKIGIWEMDGTTNLGWTTINNGVNTVWEIPVVGDFTGDGKTDILWRHATSGKIGIWEMDGTATLGWTTISNGVNAVWEIR
jgi:hypothetical protein